jgi:hypothetical protein
MDIFDVLATIAKRKIRFMKIGMDELDALILAELCVSKEYHISLLDIKKLLG